MAVAERPSDSTITPSDGWRRDKDAEVILADNGIAWEYATLPLNLIDRDLSLKNNARVLPGGVDVDEAEIYAADMVRGSVFPALVVFPLPNGTYILASGNHRRYAAEKAGRKQVDAYVARTTDLTMRTLLTQTFNKRNGIRPPAIDRASQALQWARDAGRSLAFAAEKFGVGEHTLRRMQAEERREQRFRVAGIRTEGIRKRTQELIARIPNDPPMVRAAELIREAKLPETDVETLIEHVREQRTEAGQLAAVERFSERDDVRQRRADNGTPSRRRNRPPWSRLLGTLRTADKILGETPSRLQLGLTNDEDYQTVISLAERVWERLMNLPERPHA